MVKSLSESDIQGIATAESKIRDKVRCPHCRHRWRPVRKDAPRWCPECHHSLRRTEPSEKLYLRKSLPMLTEINRFTPEAMKGLINFKLYRYSGMPKAVKVPGARARQHRANMRLADKYLTSGLRQSDLAEALGFESRAALNYRVRKGFTMLLERGCFQLTAKGREKVAREKLAKEVQT